MDKSNIPPPRAWLFPALCLGAIASAQPLDLARALRIADEKAFGNRLASAREQSSSGQKLSAWAGFVPAVRLEAGALVTDDPLGAFGTRLGQRRVSMASFDPASLNDPSAIASLFTSVIAEVPLLNVDAWHGMVATDRNLQAARRAVDLERQRVRAQVVEAWFGVGLARAAVVAWDTGLAVARSYERQAMSGQRNETATRSDVLRSRVEVASIGASLAKARTDVVLAEKRLAMLLGGGVLPGDVPLIDLTDSVLVRQSRNGMATGPALELEVVGLQADAAKAAWCRTRDAFLPRLNGMARVDWKEHASMFQKDPSWSVGIVASWNVLGGAQALGSEREARGRWREAETGREALRSQQALERDSERAKLSASLERLDIERGSLEQVSESHRIVSRRYDEGLATIAERIEAGALETKIRLEMVALRQEAVTSLAKLALLEGRDPSDLISLSIKN
jgi:outer membrane protein TolC